jgi:hypothetical protein
VRRQKAGAVLIGFLSWTRLLSGASVSSQRMSGYSNSVKSRGEDRDGKLHYLYPSERIRWPGACERFRFPVGGLARIKPIELKSHSKSPVSQGVARSGTANGIRIAVQSVSMRPMRKREYRGSSRCLSRRNANIFRHFLFGNNSIVFRASGRSTSPTGISPPLSCLGSGDSPLVHMDRCRIQVDFRSP